MNDRTKLQQLEVRLSYVAVDHAHLQLEKVQKLHCLQVCMIDSLGHQEARVSGHETRVVSEPESGVE